MTENDKLPPMTRLVAMFLRGDVALLLILVSLMLGAAALYLTPREEEPQIVVPMADVLVSAPGLSAREVEQQTAGDRQAQPCIGGVGVGLGQPIVHSGGQH